MIWKKWNRYNTYVSILLFKTDDICYWLIENTIKYAGQFLPELGAVQIHH